MPASWRMPCSATAGSCCPVADRIAWAGHGRCCNIARAVWRAMRGRISAGAGVSPMLLSAPCMAASCTTDAGHAAPSSRCSPAGSLMLSLAALPAMPSFARRTLTGRSARNRGNGR